jgi:exoribonuclease-2
MIIANTVWSGALAEKNAPAFYRVQVGGKVKSSSQADAHQGLNVPHYMWSTSPLRRYADLLNQQQLIAHYRAETLPYQANDSTLLEAITHFDTAYAVYRHFQDQMEHYWCLRWLAQEQIAVLEAKTLVREHLVRLERLPLVVKVSDLPTGMPAGTRCWIRVDHIDLWGLQASWHFSEWFESTTPCDAASEVAASEQEPSAS